jgi:hypothetical protein
VINRIVDQVKLLSDEQDEEEEEMNNRNQWNVAKPLAKRVVKSGAVRCHPDLYNYTWVSYVPCSVWTGLQLIILCAQLVALPSSAIGC